jgi:hypothetical protein
MMRKIYVLYQTYHANNYTWETEIQEIKEVNPDLILCLCLEEFDYQYIFRLFFDGIKDWVKETDTIVKVLVPSPDNVELYPNIYTESTCGYYAWYEGLFREQIDKTNVVVDNVFTCYNNNPKFERALLIEELAKRNLLKNGIVTFKYPDNVQHEYHGPRNFAGWKYHDGSRLVDEEDFELNSSKKFLPASYPKSYFRGFFDLVTESVCLPEHFFCTEKTAKSVNALKPFICLANPLYHTKYLVEEYGLELYDELFDYSFDETYDIDKRIELIVDNVERITNDYSTEYKDKMLEVIYPKLIRNRQRLKDYGKIREKIIPRSFMFLFDRSVPYTVYGHKNHLQNYVNYYSSKGWKP